MLRSDVSRANRRLALLGAIMLSGCLVSAWGISARAGADQETAQPRCIKAQRVTLADGGREGQAWKVEAGIHSQTGCASWLMEVKVSPSGVAQGSSSWGWGIPAGGCFPNNVNLAAQDDTAGARRAFSGVTTASTRRLVVDTRQGQRIVINPKLPSLGLRRAHHWIRNMRYFMRFLPKDEGIAKAQGYDAAGLRQFVVRGSEGSFEGSSGPPDQGSCSLR